MVKALGILLAALVIALPGCAFDVGSTRVDVAVQIDEQAVDAKLEDAARRIKEDLQRRGIDVSVTQEKNAARLACTAKSGDKFAVVLRRVRSASGAEQTKVRVEWEKAPDRELWLAMVLVAGSVALDTTR